MGKVYTCLTHRWIEQRIFTKTCSSCGPIFIEKCRLFVAVKVRDDATNEDIEKAINVAYLDDDCEVLEQRLLKLLI